MAARPRSCRAAPTAHRLHLHARELSIPHPAGGTLRVTAPLPPHMRRMWEFFGFAGDAGDPFAELGSAGMKRVYKSAEILPVAMAAGASRSTAGRCAPRQSTS